MVVVVVVVEVVVVVVVAAVLVVVVAAVVVVLVVVIAVVVVSVVLEVVVVVVEEEEERKKERKKEKNAHTAIWWTVTKPTCVAWIVPTYGIKTNLLQLITSKLLTSLVAWWSELLTTNHEVPGSIPGSTMCFFLERGRRPMVTMVWVVGRN